ncbi:MAG TPA: DUF308 domain-containing protein [bacterium]|nr:DUF308 domain-containing protein [bacterium]
MPSPPTPPTAANRRTGRSLSGLQLAYILCRNWWVLLVRGVITIAFGIIVVMLVRLQQPFSAYALVDGILGVGIVAGEIPGRPYWWVLLVRGLASAGAGLLMFFSPPAALLEHLFYVAGWMTVTGVADIMTAYYLRKKLGGEWLLVLGGIASFVFAGLVIALSGSGTLALARVIAAYGVFCGVVVGILAFRARMASLPPA